VLREDVEDQHRAVDDRQRHDLLEVRPLARSQVVEDEQHVGAQLLGPLGDLPRLPAADQRRRIDVRQLLHDFADDARPRRLGQRLELDQFRCERPAGILQIDGDDQRALLRGPRRKEAAMVAHAHVGIRPMVAISHAKPSL
jgi:hypothetical protein